MKIKALLATAALGLAACSPAPAEEAGANAKRIPLADCAEAPAKNAEADGWQHTDCRRMLPDDSGYAIEARYTPAEDDSTKITVQVVAPGDATTQTIEERMGNTMESVALKDLDGDGKPDIWIPLETIEANTTWAIHRQIADGKFDRVGEPIGNVVKTESGLYAAQSREEDLEWAVAFYKLDGENLRLLATADVVAEGDVTAPTKVTCTVEPGDYFRLAGVAAEAAEDTFCAEPTVVEIFQQ